MEERFNNMRDAVREESKRDLNLVLEEKLNLLKSEGYDVEFGQVGKRTTYAMIFNGDEEYVGWSYLRKLEYFKEVVGKLKALQQASVRKVMIDRRRMNADGE